MGSAGLWSTGGCLRGSESEGEAGFWSHVRVGVSLQAAAPVRPRARPAFHLPTEALRAPAAQRIGSLKAFSTSAKRHCVK